MIGLLWAMGEKIINQRLDPRGFVRGFIFSGLTSSIVGPKGAILITSFIWTAVHIQYDFYWLVSIFVVGIALGIARYKTGSVILTIGLHVLINLGAMVTTAIAIS